MTMQVSQTIGTTDKVALDPPIFDPVAFRLSDEQAGIITRAREIGQSVFAGRAATYDREAIFPTENYRDLHRVGLLGIAVPKKHGGLGANYQTYAWRRPRSAAIAAQRRSPGICMSARPCGRARLPTISTWTPRPARNTSGRRAVHYKRIVEDGAIYSQPSRGRCGGRRRRRLRHGSKTGRGWLDRQRQEDLCVALRARRLLRRALYRDRARRKASRRNTLYLAIPAKSQGVSVVGDWDPLGMRGTVSRTLLFKDVFVPDDLRAHAARRLLSGRDALAAHVPDAVADLYGPRASGL